MPTTCKVPGSIPSVILAPVPDAGSLDFFPSVSGHPSIRHTWTTMDVCDLCPPVLLGMRVTRQGVTNLVAEPSVTSTEPLWVLSARCHTRACDRVAVFWEPSPRALQKAGHDQKKK